MSLDTWQLIDTYASAFQQVLLYGPPGTGKTHAAMHAGDPDDMPAAELRGHWIPQGPTWQWHDGPLTRAYVDGGRAVVDEITRATDDALSFLLAILDGHPITLPDGRTIHRSRGFSLWATTNDSADDLSGALADRFVVRVACDIPHPAILDRFNAAFRDAIVSRSISARQAGEYHRLLPIMGAKNAALAVWEERAVELQYALSLRDEL